MSRPRPTPEDPPLAALSAASAILDLANGLDHDKSVITGLFAFELARDAGLSSADQRSAFFAALLRQLGCTGYASVEARIATDDIELRGRLMRGDTSSTRDLLGAVVSANSSLVSAAIGTAWVVAHARRVRLEWTAEVCGAARLLAQQLGLGDGVVQALDQTFERFDGQGQPLGLAGHDLSPAARVVRAAHVAIVFWLDAGIDAAIEMLAARSGAEIDPEMSRRAARLLPAFGAPAGAELQARVEATEQALGENPITATVATVAITFGEFADLQTPYTLGHSHRVAELAVRAAAELGIDGAEREELRLAAHLHDLGHVAVPAAIWQLPRAWQPRERERAHSHTFWTENILGAAAPLARIAKIAGAHHERLDGSGYHRALRDATLSRAARLLAAADVATALREPRPHRAAMNREAARQVLIDAARTGLLDGECVEAVLAAQGEPGARGLAGPVATLTAREQDVLRQLAHGHTNKEIGRALGISDRTVQHHTIAIYRKLGVDTRAAAALVAARHGLV
jgi:HD-GYP domain-containing protein (c-di-GMP phosphodiesterase class II)/DNA-binding CsgD family transcriptional regulator